MQPMLCGLPIKTTGRCLLVVEAILNKFLLILAIATIVFSDNWLPVFHNWAFLIFSLLASLSFSFCHSKQMPLLVIPMLVYESVVIFWIFIWLYASLTSIATGNLWSLEWLGGPKSSRDPISHDITDPNYADPNESNPDTKRSIRMGIIVTVTLLALLVIKIVLWQIAKKTYSYLREGLEEDVEEYPANEEEIEKESDLGAESPPYPVVKRIEPPRSPVPQYKHSRQDSDLGAESPLYPVVMRTHPSRSPVGPPQYIDFPGNSSYERNGYSPVKTSPSHHRESYI